MFGPRTRIGTTRAGAREYCYALRPGGGSFVLFVHGLGCTKASFATAFGGNDLDPRLSLCAVDLPGHGGSAHDPARDDDLYAIGDELGALLQGLGASRVHIVAHSMGNLCALQLARGLDDLGGFYSMEGNLVEADCVLSRRICGFSEDAFVSKFHPMAKKQFLCPGCDNAGADPVALYRMARSLVAHSADDAPLERYLALDAPRLYFHGARSGALPVLGRLDPAECMVVPDAGHFPMNDAPDLVWGEIGRRIGAG